MKTTTPFLFLLLLQGHAWSQTFVKSTTLSVDYVKSKEKYLTTSMQSEPNFLCKGVDFQNDKFYFYTRFFQEGLVKTNQKEFPSAKYMLPMAGILSVDLELERPAVDLFHLRLYDITKESPHAYQLSSGKKVDLPKQSGPDELRYKTFEVIGDDQKDMPTAELEGKYPMLFEPLSPAEKQSVTGAEGYALGNCYQFTYTSTTSGTYKPALCGYEGNIDNSKRITTGKNLVSDKNSTVPFLSAVYNPHKKEWFGVLGEKDSEVKWSVFKFFHFVIYDQYGEIISNHRIDYEFLKGVDHIQYVADVDKPEDGVYLVLLNSKPVAGLGKLKETNLDKHHILVFDVAGKLLYQLERDVASNKNVYVPMYAYKKGEVVYLLENIGDFTKKTYDFSKISKEGVQKTQHNWQDIIAEPGSTFMNNAALSSSSSFSAIDSKKVGNKFYVWGCQKSDVTDARLNRIITYPTLHVMEFNLETDDFMQMYSFVRKDIANTLPPDFEEVVENNGNLFFLTTRALRPRNDVDKAMTNLCNSNQYVKQCFPTNDVTVPVIYGVRPAEKKAITFTSPDPKFLNLFSKNYYVLKEKSLYLFGYNETSYGKTTFQVMKIGL